MKEPLDEVTKTANGIKEDCANFRNLITRLGGLSDQESVGFGEGRQDTNRPVDETEDNKHQHYTQERGETSSEKLKREAVAIQTIAKECKFDKVFKLFKAVRRLNSEISCQKDPMVNNIFNDISIFRGNLLMYILEH